ncbi:transcriptional regulator, AraC family [Nocardioides sp. YR527]|uniref:AraC family transcriptional regulator n=1 Tax=Nocardioides sp. YR527 TaxID=1881028 RepID=UPI000884B649|nr:AraC family transcriptional regulator [Nocardioides sp. YR527]SDJ70576.1 transcriptional regulator, AraC family [Nocardioides sp. YR527]
MTQRTIPVRFLRAAARTARRRDVDAQEWLDHLGIDPELLFDDRARITLEQATEIVQELWRLTGDEWVGLGARPSPFGTFRMVCLGLMSAPDLRGVMERARDFSRVLPGLPTFDLEVGERTTQLTLDTESLDDPDHFVTDIALSVGLRFFSWLAGSRLPVEQVSLPYERPERAEDYDQVFGRRIAFGQATASLRFSNELLTLPVMRTEEELEEWLRNAPADLLMYRDYGATPADQVRRILERGLRGPWPTPDEVASQLAMSTQHLRRVLREDDTSMSAIKEELLRDAAIASLVAGEETIAALSERLGFSEPSAFHRAFRRWTGSAPGAYRPKSAQDASDD